MRIENKNIDLIAQIQVWCIRNGTEQDKNEEL